MPLCFSFSTIATKSTKRKFPLNIGAHTAPKLRSANSHRHRIDAVATKNIRGGTNVNDLTGNIASWDPSLTMTQATQQLLEQFEALPDEERSEFVTELARRVALAPHGAPTDDDLIAAADRLFLDLDRREQS